MTVKRMPDDQMRLIAWLDFAIFRCMLRPRKKYTVRDLQLLKGKRCLTHIHVKSPEEATAAEQAGVDLMSCSFDSPAAQQRFPSFSRRGTQ
jgi:hypothetical protein